MKEAFVTWFITVTTVVFWCLITVIGLLPNLTIAEDATAQGIYFLGVIFAITGMLLIYGMIFKWREKP